MSGAQTLQVECDRLQDEIDQIQSEKSEIQKEVEGSRKLIDDLRSQVTRYIIHVSTAKFHIFILAVSRRSV